jgi:muramoyltetrapeptide carboxypeptidase LdcA involved in peptidoglycan recycling
MLRSSRLKSGDTIGIISPSWGGVGAFPHRVEQGIKFLGTLGFKVELAQHAMSQNGFVSDTPANRAQDIHEPTWILGTLLHNLQFHWVV